MRRVASTYVRTPAERCPGPESALCDDSSTACDPPEVSVVESPECARRWGDRRIVGALAVLALLACCDGGGSPIEVPRSVVLAAMERPPAQSDDVTAEQLAQMRALEALGYSGAAVVAPSEGGVTIHDPARACAGLNLCVSGHAAEASLIDMTGRTVHRWSCAFGKVWPEGTRDLTGIDAETHSFRRAWVMANGDLLAIFEGLGLIKLDRDSNLLWSYARAAHHDLAFTPEGYILILTRVARLRPEVDPTGPILDDQVTMLDGSGREIDSLSILDACLADESVSLRMTEPGDMLHTNTLQWLDGRARARVPAFAAGNLLLSLRNCDQLVVFDPARCEIVWEHSGPWKRQHQPELLENGNVLVFNNRAGYQRSAVVEFDPLTGETVWEYAPETEGEFFSLFCGSCQRLSNGNTLIVESESARAFEVTPEGEKVWEFKNPHVSWEDPTRAAILYDVVRLARDFPTDWLE